VLNGSVYIYLSVLLFGFHSGVFVKAFLPPVTTDLLSKVSHMAQNVCRSSNNQNVSGVEHILSACLV
jgi:hypothetical protein